MAIKKDVTRVPLVLIIAVAMAVVIGTENVAYAQDCKEPGSYCVAVEGFVDECCGDYTCKSSSCQPCPTPFNGMACSKFWTDQCCDDYTCDAWFTGGTCHEKAGPGEYCGFFTPCRKGYTCSAWFYDGTCNAS